MIFNVREQPEPHCNIKVVQKKKYLGIEIENKIKLCQDTKRQNYTKCKKDCKYNIYIVCLFRHKAVIAYSHAYNIIKTS